MMSPSRSIDSKHGIRSADHSPTGGPRRSARPALSSTPTAFFVRSGEEVEQLTESNLSIARQESFGVKSLDSTTCATEEAGQGYDHGRPLGIRVAGSTNTESLAPAQPSKAIAALRANAGKDLFNQQSTLRPLHMNLVPLRLDLAGTDSAPASTPRSASLRSVQLSDDESLGGDIASQAVTSGGEEEEYENRATRAAVTESGVVSSPEAAPQLVMPSLTLPTRRPFSSNGRNMGKLKVLIAGRPGTGKSSLIRALIQSNDDIVHVEPPSQPQIEWTRANVAQCQGCIFRETLASTRAYPTFRQDIEEGKPSKRRKSGGESILERNLAFVEAEVSHQKPSNDGPHSIVEYVKHHLQRNFDSSSLSDSELMGLLSGQGGVQVDLVIYVFTESPQPAELELLKELCQLTNILPICSQADRLQSEQIQLLKTSISTDLSSWAINVSQFDEVDNEVPREGGAEIFAVSSSTVSDDDNMDASLLMSPEYKPPLFPSDLPDLVRAIFNADRAMALRYMAARKSIQWRKKQMAKDNGRSTINATQALGSASSMGVGSQVGTKHTKPSRWAVELQRALNNENARMLGQSAMFDAATRARLTNWLTDSSHVQNATSPSSEHAQSDSSVEPYHEKIENFASIVYMDRIDDVDPLGLIEWNEKLRARAMLLAKVIGGCGIVGAVTVWVLRTIGFFNGSDYGSDPFYSPASWVEEKWSGGLGIARH